MCNDQEWTANLTVTECAARRIVKCRIAVNSSSEITIQTVSGRVSFIVAEFALRADDLHAAAGRGVRNQDGLLLL